MFDFAVGFVLGGFVRGRVRCVYPIYGYIGIAVMLLISARLIIVAVQRKRKGKLGSDLLG